MSHSGWEVHEVTGISRRAWALLGKAESRDSLSLLLVDVAKVHAFEADSRVASVSCDIGNSRDLERLIPPDTGAIYHLAAIVSDQADVEFDHGMKINFDTKRSLLEVGQRLTVPPKLIFTGSPAVFGGNLPEIINDQTAVTPQSSNGTQKVMGELRSTNSSGEVLAGAGTPKA